MDVVKRIALSGGPGAGKTSVVDKLQSLGHAVVGESARQYISDRKAKGMSPRPPIAEFACALLEKDMEQYKGAVPNESYIFFDRTVIDSLCMLSLQNCLPSEKRAELLARYRYNPIAFMFPPWREIYCTDSERDQSYEESITIFESLERWYVDCGYKTVIVPPASVDERCAYILRSLDISN